MEKNQTKNKTNSTNNDPQNITQQLSYTNPTENRVWAQILRKGKQFEVYSIQLNKPVASRRYNRLFKFHVHYNFFVKLSWFVLSQSFYREISCFIYQYVIYFFLFTHVRWILMFVSVTKRMALVDQELPTFPDHPSSTPVFVGFVLLNLYCSV